MILDGRTFGYRLRRRRTAIYLVKLFDQYHLLRCLIVIDLQMVEVMYRCSLAPLCRYVHPNKRFYLL